MSVTTQVLGRESMALRTHSRGLTGPGEGTSELSSEGQVDQNREGCAKALSRKMGGGVKRRLVHGGGFMEL